MAYASLAVFLILAVGAPAAMALSEEVKLALIDKLPSIINSVGTIFGVAFAAIAAKRAKRALDQGKINGEQGAAQGAAAIEAARDAKTAVIEVKQVIADKVESAASEVSSKIEHNTNITVAGAQEAKLAYSEANNVNQKIAALHNDHNDMRRELIASRQQFTDTVKKLQEITAENRGVIEEVRDREAKHARLNRENQEKLRMELEKARAVLERLKSDKPEDNPK